MKDYEGSLVAPGQIKMKSGLYCRTSQSLSYAKDVVNLMRDIEL